MLRRALVLALALAVVPRSYSQAAVAGLDRPVPADALAYATADSLESLAAVLQPPGATPGNLAAMMPPLLAAPGVDRSRPVAMTWLAT